ncbi:hypothetical protein V6R86_10740 [Sphingomonas kaistensis]|uniref:DUF1488 family protein n=1 Tax=Sphingomonas kaistensis TaxID=298708 RepID=A0ABZ2G423_9SPHN
MRLFQFFDLTCIEAYVIAANHDDAHELFEEHVIQHGGDPDKLRWREMRPKHLNDFMRVVVQDALTIAREGLVVEAGTGRWVFVVPLSDVARQR